MKISSRTARIATATFLVGAFVVGGGVASTNARGISKPSAPSSMAPRTKNAALPTTLPPKLSRKKNGALTSSLAPKKTTSTSMPRIKNGALPRKPRPAPSAPPKGS